MPGMPARVLGHLGVEFRAERGRWALAAQNSSFLLQLAVGRAAVPVSRMGCGGRDR